MFDACEILSGEGCGGISDGLSVNMTFLSAAQQHVAGGMPPVHNAEVAPPAATAAAWDSAAKESSLSVLTMSPGDRMTHCNKFLRIKSPQIDGLPLWSSNHRHAVLLDYGNNGSPASSEAASRRLLRLPRVESASSSVVAILGDQTDVTKL